MKRVSLAAAYVLCGSISFEYFKTQLDPGEKEELDATDIVIMMLGWPLFWMMLPWTDHLDAWEVMKKQALAEAKKPVAVPEFR